MDDRVYLTITSTAKELEMDKNISRSKSEIKKQLELLKNHGLIDYDFDIKQVNDNDIVEIQWNNLYKDYDFNMIKFYADDFYLFKKLSSMPYVIMWMLRMLSYEENGIASIGYEDMYNILKCDINTIFNTIQLFTKLGLFHVKTGEYISSTNGRKNKQPNGYMYTGLTKEVNKLNKDDITELIKNGFKNPKKCINEYKYHTKGIDCTNSSGVYFIYDKDNLLAYIGKSVNCVVTRCFQSIKERDLESFSKIEIIPICTKVDTDIYESYYIQKYKPYLNTMSVYEDEISGLRLPELDVKQTFIKI